jgi:signal transduction histidine kinase
MDVISSFFTQHIIHVYFVYGLAFFAMGLAVALESGRASELILTRALPSLAAFGLIHGANEWLEMFIRFLPASSATDPSLALRAFKLSLLATSFVFLVAFGVRLIALLNPNRFPQLYLAPAILVAIFLAGLVLIRVWLTADPVEWLRLGEVWIRYSLGLPGSLLACWALLEQRRAFKRKDLPQLGSDLIGATLTLVWYTILDVLIGPKTPFFPSSVINSTSFFQLIGVPVQVFRAIATIALAYFIIRVLRVFEIENRRRIELANQARLVAQEEALAAQRRIREETETWNQQLQRAAKELSVLFEISRLAASGLDLDRLLHEAIARIVQMLEQIEGGLILLFDSDASALCCRASYWINSVESADGHLERVLPTANRAFESGQIVQTIYPPLPLANESASPGRPPVRRGIAVPVVSHDQPIGTLYLEGRPGAMLFSAADLPTVTAIARQLAIAIERVQLYIELQHKEELRGQLLQRAVSAQEEERKRIARELHDDTGQVLTALAMGLTGLENTLPVDPGLAQRQLAELRALGVRALDGLRQLISDLRPSLLDDLGLVAALRWYADDYSQRMSIATQLEVSGDKRRLPPEVETILFRIVQEALTNVAKHAAACNVLVRLEFGTATVRLTVHDDGRGFNPAAVLGAGPRRWAWGLLGIQERVALAGGDFEIESQPGAGTSLRVQIPIEDRDNVRGHSVSQG